MGKPAELRNKELVDTVCSICGKSFQMTYGHYRRKQYQGKHQCKKCAQQTRANANKTKWENATPEERSNRMKNMIVSKTNPMHSLTELEKKQWRIKISASKKERSLGQLTDKQREIFGDAWSELTQAERNRTHFTEKCQDCGESFELTYGHYSKSPKNHHWRCKKCRYAHHAKVMQVMDPLKTYRETATPEEWQRRGEQHRRWYHGLASDRKAEITKSTISPSSGNNKFHKRFEENFNASYISNTFYLTKEEITTENDIIKSWDYGIYSRDNNRLVMVVDLDGAYYHADNSDYTGTHSHEEYDERRFQSVPILVKTAIIYELKFKQSLEKLIRALMQDYDQFIEEQFKICRSIPFPYPHYADTELWKSWEKLYQFEIVSKLKLSINSRLGDRIITHFHHSIYEAKVGNGPSPFDAWHDDKLLRKVIENRMIYINTLNPNKILQGFNISKIGQKVSVFSAGRAKLLIHRYLSEYDEVFDPFSGFSGRMLGTVSLGKKYIGQDISSIHVKETNDIIDYFDWHDKASVTVDNCLTSSGTYQCLFTCPPYGDTERWLDVPVDTRSCDDWIDVCLSNFKCDRYLFVVDITKKYIDNVVDTITNKSHFGANEELIVELG